MKSQVAVCGVFDNISSRTVRFLEEAASFGELTALVWSDEAMTNIAGMPPKFPLAERLYFLNAIRYVKQACPLVGSTSDDIVSSLRAFKTDHWILDGAASIPEKRVFAEQGGFEYRVLSDEQVRGVPVSIAMKTPPADTSRKRVIVTGSFDWFHSGHVRFFEECSGLGDLYVVVGHDANIKLLKGEGHPLFGQDERRYLVGSIQFVTEALISTGHGWLDAEPEMLRLKPDIYAVNEDGDKGGKREYCEKNGIEYVVLKRTPAPGLPGRSSTQLRGF